MYHDRLSFRERKCGSRFKSTYLAIHIMMKNELASTNYESKLIRSRIRFILRHIESRKDIFHYIFKLDSSNLQQTKTKIDIDISKNELNKTNRPCLPAKQRRLYAYTIIIKMLYSNRYSSQSQKTRLNTTPIYSHIRVYQINRLGKLEHRTKGSLNIKMCVHETSSMVHSNWIWSRKFMLAYIAPNLNKEIDNSLTNRVENNDCYRNKRV